MAFNIFLYWSFFLFRYPCKRAVFLLANCCINTYYNIHVMHFILETAFNKNDNKRWVYRRQIGKVSCFTCFSLKGYKNLLENQLYFEYCSRFINLNWILQISLITWKVHVRIYVFQFSDVCHDLPWYSHLMDCWIRHRNLWLLFWRL